MTDGTHPPYTCSRKRSRCKLHEHIIRKWYYVVWIHNYQGRLLGIAADFPHRPKSARVRLGHSRRILVARHSRAPRAALAPHARRQGGADVRPHLACAGADVSGFRRCVPWHRSAVFLGHRRHLLCAAVDRARISRHRARRRRFRFAGKGVRVVVG